MPQLTIDGKQLDFEPSETIIEVATRNKIEIPYYCWHPRLSVAANCRMCLVEVEKAPKLLPACQTECRDGMAVHTQNETVKGAQRAVHEFLLINHPIDCPICDQAGECKLQDYYMKFQLHSSPMRDRKVHKPRLEPLGPYVIYNAERCIVCTRCIRFMEEVAQDRQLGVFNRGDHSEIGVMPGRTLDSPYSLNTVDVCPVGALTSRAFRFKQRVWNLRRTQSVCPGCARGCNTHVDQRSGQVYRMLPRENDDVNQSWMCDEGRLTYNRANEGRLTHPLLAAEPSQGPQALARAIELLKEARGEGDVAVAVSMHATCEEAYAVGRLAKEALGAETVAVLGLPDGEGDDILRVSDRNPNRAGLSAVFEDLGLIVVGADVLCERLGSGQVTGFLLLGHEVEQVEELVGAAGRVKAFVHIAHARTALADAAPVTLPGLSWVQQDGTWVNVDRRVQRLIPAFAPEGGARPPLAWLSDIAEGLGAPLALPSAQTVRAELERRLATFKSSQLTQLGPLGQSLGASSKKER